MSALQSKPSLHEIAAMPYPASQEAMRRHYNPQWGKPVPEGATAPRKFRVAVDYMVSATTTFEVVAWTEDEAEELASDKAAKEFGEPGSTFEVDACRILKGEPQ